jgi:hypothetical protein
METSKMTQHVKKTTSALMLSLLVGACLLVFAIIFSVSDSGTSGNDDTLSSVFVRNDTGFNVRFEKVIVDDQLVWEEPDLIFMSKRNLEKPWLDTRRHAFGFDFRAPKKFVELKIATLNDLQERDTVSCALDNRLKPCFFEVSYQKGRLFCSHCSHLR